jgi:cytochrome c
MGGIALIGLTIWLMPGVKVQVVHGQDTSVEKGKGLYQRLCCACHGKAGRGTDMGFLIRYLQI